jgi:8-oxo-dGTP pyrophosphatase MutT (NUDIX family)
MHWKTLSRSTVYLQPPWLEVEECLVETPDGQQIERWPWVTTPNYVNILPEIRPGIFLLFRQTKYGLDGLTLALVGGYIQPTEAPQIAAQRELLEETGCRADTWINLGHYLVDPNRGVATGHLYLARQVHPAGQRPPSDDLEAQERVELSQAELEDALDRGEIKVLAWAAAVAFALRLLGKNQHGQLE